MTRAESLAGLMETMWRMKMAITKAQATNAAKKGMPTPSELAVLLILVRNGGPLGVGEIAERLCTSPSAATQLVEGLVEKGLLARKEDATDRRKRAVSLTRRSMIVLSASRKHHQTALSKLFEPLTDAELEQYVTLQRKITKQFS